MSSFCIAVGEQEEAAFGLILDPCVHPLDADLRHLLVGQAQRRAVVAELVLGDPLAVGTHGVELGMVVVIQLLGHQIPGRVVDPEVRPGLLGEQFRIRALARVAQVVTGGPQLPRPGRRDPAILERRLVREDERVDLLALQRGDRLGRSEEAAAEMLEQPGYAEQRRPLARPGHDDPTVPGLDDVAVPTNGLELGVGDGSGRLRGPLADEHDVLGLRRDLVEGLHLQSDLVHPPEVPSELFGGFLLKRQRIPGGHDRLQRGRIDSRRVELLQPRPGRPLGVQVVGGPGNACENHQAPEEPSMPRNPRKRHGSSFPRRSRPLVFSLPGSMCDVVNGRRPFLAVGL